MCSGDITASTAAATAAGEQTEVIQGQGRQADLDGGHLLFHLLDSVLHLTTVAGLEYTAANR